MYKNNLKWLSLVIIYDNRDVNKPKGDSMATKGDSDKIIKSRFQTNRGREWIRRIQRQANIKPKTLQ